MPRVLFVNTNISWNKGSAAQVAGAIKAVRRYIPDAEFSLISYCAHLDSPAAQRQHVKVVGYPDGTSRRLGMALIHYSTRLVMTLACSLLWKLASMIGITPRHLLREKYLAEYLSADIVIDLSGDSLSDTGAHPLPNFLGMLIAVILEKPYVAYSQSIGPFSRCSVPIARFCLNRARAITVREHITTEYLKKIGVFPEIIHEFGDCAFAMDSESEDRVLDILRDENIASVSAGGYIGISVSALVSDISRRTNQMSGQPGDELDPYLRLLLKIIDHLTEQGHDIILVSHVIAPRSWIRDDRAACEDLIRHMERHKDRVSTLAGDYSPEELKAVISRCNIFIGSRMHACIAALSTSVPTITLGWSHKYDGIMKRLGMEEYSYAIQGIDEKNLIDSIDRMIECRDNLTKVVADRVASEIESALDGATVIRRILQTEKSATNAIDTDSSPSA